jgi:uncharacterized membrane protein
MDEQNQTLEDGSTGDSSGTEASGGNGGIASQVQEKLAPVADQMREAVTPMVSQAQQKTGEIVSQVQQQAASRLDQQKEHVVGGLSSVADSLRQTGQQLRDNVDGVVPQYAAQYSESAAQQVEKISTYLRERDANQIVREIESFGRREPALFVAGAFVLGLLGARFLRASAPPVTTLATLPATDGGSNSSSNGVTSADFAAAPVADYNAFAE